MIVLPGVKEVEVSFSIHKRVENEKVNDYCSNLVWINKDQQVSRYRAPHTVLNTYFLLDKQSIGYRCRMTQQYQTLL